MPLVVDCKNCGRSFKVPDQLAGRKVKCPQCSAVVNTGAAAGASAASEGSASNEDDGLAERLKQQKRRRTKSSGDGKRWVLWSALGVVAAGVVIGLIVLVVSVVNSLPDSEDNLTIGDVIRAVQDTDKETVEVAKRHRGKPIRWEGRLTSISDDGTIANVEIHSRRAALFDGAKTHIIKQMARVRLQEKPAKPPSRGEKVVFEGKVGERILNWTDSIDEVIDKSDTSITFEKDVRVRTTTVEAEEGRIVPGQ